MDTTRDYHTSEAFQTRKKNIMWYHLYVESKIGNRPISKQKQTQGTRTGLWLPRLGGGDWGERWNRELGSADVSYYIQNR